VHGRDAVRVAVDEQDRDRQACHLVSPVIGSAQQCTRFVNDHREAVRIGGDLGERIAELAAIHYHPGDPARSDLDLEHREIRVRGKGGRDRTVRIDHEAARRLDRYLRARVRHEQAHRLALWLGTGGRGPLTANGIYQMVKRRGGQARVDV
jgi:site-specific recombinase XerC